MREVMKPQFEIRDRRIELLERALEQVMKCKEKCEYIAPEDSQFYTPQQLQPFNQRCVDAVRESQRIILEAWDDKNYFWK